MIVRGVSLHTGDRFRITLASESFTVQVGSIAKLENDVGQDTVVSVTLFREDNGERISLDSLSR